MISFSQVITHYKNLTKFRIFFSNLKHNRENVLSWFQVNSLKANPSII